MLTVNGLELEKDFKFSGGELQIRLPYLVSFKDFYIKTRLKSSDDIIKLLLVVNALREKKGKLAYISVRIGYLPYARQDRVCYPGEANSSKVMRELISLIDADLIWIADLHSKQPGLPDNVHEITVLDIVKEHKEVFENYNYLVAPDKGSWDKVKSVGEALGIKVLCFNKVRDPQNGNIVKYEKVGEPAIFKRLDKVLVVDDICDGGYTFKLLSHAISTKEGPELSLYVTHGIFSKGLLGLKEAGYQEIITTDSFYEDKKGLVVDQVLEL